MAPVAEQLVLVIDVGNTSTSLGLSCRGKILKTDRLPTIKTEASSIERKLKRLMGNRNPAGCVYASVVPAFNRVWRQVLKNKWPRHSFLHVDYRLELGIPVTYPKPETIGADRLANACGAADRYGAPVIVADFGTAVTFDVISRKKGYIGGVIAPGLPLMFDYLAEKTALLPHIGPGPVRRRVGKNTQEAMRLGATWGYRGLVREIIQEIETGLKEGPVALCATGGYAGWVLKGSGIPMTIDPDLTLRGLGRIYELNQ